MQQNAPKINRKFTPQLSTGDTIGPNTLYIKSICYNCIWKQSIAHWL